VIRVSYRLAGFANIIRCSRYRRSGIAPCPEGLYRI